MERIVAQELGWAEPEARIKDDRWAKKFWNGDRGWISAEVDGQPQKSSMKLDSNIKKIWKCLEEA